MFVHLHVHSDNSILNGVIKVEKIVKKTKEYGMPAVALTDNGSMYPTFSFYKKCKDEGLKPIFGCQVAVAPRTRFDKEAKKDEKTTEIVLLATSLVGYRNLIKIVTLGHLEGFYYKSRVDKDLLKENSKDLICLSGGENGEIFKNFLLGNNDKAKEIALEYKEIYGDNFYIEIQRTGTHAQEIVNPKLVELSKETGIPLVATNNVYYEKQEDSEVREVLWCIDGGRLMSDPARRRPESSEEYFRSPDEMEELFKDLPEAIENTVKISEKIESFSIGFGKVQPVYPNIPEGESEETYLRKLVFEYAANRFGYYNDEVEERLNNELKVIHDKGYDGYFLVVWDVANWARSHGISVNARGSAAGSAVAFVLGITTVDPIKWKLFFERFLNPERPSFPDIDLDIADNRRDELIEHVKKTYGYDNVSNVGALGKLTTKAAIRDIGRVLAIELPVIDKISKLVPVKFGRVTSISACLSDDLAGKEIKVIEENREAVTELRRILKTDDGINEVENLVDIKMCGDCFTVYFDGDKDECKKCHKELKTIAQVSPQFAKLIKYVQKIEGGIRQVSTHACGHLITPDAIVNYCPLQIETGSGKRMITQFEGKYLEDVGLMKFDFLGLANLSIIDTTVKFIQKYKGIDFDIEKIPEDDQKSYELLQRGDTTAVFQLESSGMRKYLKELHPDNLEEISAMCALYRPGPIQFIPAFINRKFGREETKYLIPEIEDIMKLTYGLPVYQEQILQIANRIAGYSLGQADVLRRAMGKKDPAVMAAEEKKFKDGVMANTKYGEDIAQKLWEYAIPFADYGFNKSHTAAYGLIAYQTAYLKANYPTEFMAALMLCDIDTQDKLVRDILDAELRGIKLLTPDINKSDSYFSIEEDGVIRFGIGGLKGVGLKAIQSIVEERNKNGKFTSLDDLCARIDHKSVAKGTIEALIKIGAMECFGKRSALLQVFEDIYVRAQKLKSTEATGFVDMFASGEEKSTSVTKLPDIEEVDDIQKIQWENEILGVALTPSLLQKVSPYMTAKKYKMISEAHEAKENEQIRIFGQVKSKREITTKKGDQMCFADLVDVSSKISLTFFPKDFEKCGALFSVGDFIAIKGKTQKRNDEMQIIVKEVKVFDEKELRETIDKWMTKNKDKVEEYEEKAKIKEQRAKDKEQNINLEEEVLSDNKVSNESSVYDKLEIPKEIEKEMKQMEKEPVTIEEKAQKEVDEINEKQTVYSTQPQVIEIFIKKDAFLDDLKMLNIQLQQNIQENGCDVFIHLPNHESIRKIKLEGKYDPGIKDWKKDIIERISS